MNPLSELRTVGTRFGEFEVVEVLCQSARSLVLRCRQGEGSRIVKFLVGSMPGARDVARFRREYLLSRRADHPGVVAAQALGTHAGLLYLVMPDHGMASLRDQLAHGRLEAAQALQVALGVLDALEAVHGAGIVHKDVSPGNILLDGVAASVKLIDFGVAADVSSERSEAVRPAELEGALSGMAPEQSGRMHRDVDYRADLYSLGAVLFEMLAGRPPFDATDPVQVVHAHLALPPPDLRVLRPELPAVLAALVGRLLAKSPEARYQSHGVLRRDLQFILSHLGEPVPLQGYALAAGDLPQQFRMAGMLYGRSQDRQKLLQTFEAAADGPLHLVRVSGVSGIGKTALVASVRGALAGLRGNFVVGKFDQFGQHTPCAAFVQALRQRVQQVLSQAPVAQHAWSQALQGALGADTSVACAMVPELGALFGSIPPPPSVGPVEAETRFLRTMQRCFMALASADEPLVVFIDDLQWADRSARRLLRQMVANEALRNLLLVVAWRSDEVPTGHPLAADLKLLETAEGRGCALEVGPLDVEECSRWIADSLSCLAADAADLARLVHAKTGGNPFFLRRFLEEAAARRLLWLDVSQGRWRWSLEAIAREPIADNVVALLVTQLRRLPPHTVELLTVAACLGPRFGLSTLAEASGTAPAEVPGILHSALESGVLQPADGRYRWMVLLQAHEREGMQPELMFAHDRVQEAAYALADPADRPALHLRIGRLLRSGIDPDRPDFAVLNHLNLGSALMDDVQERLDLAVLDGQASRRAEEAAAFDLAADLAARRVVLQGAEWWIHAPQEALAWHVHAARMAYLADRGAQMAQWLDAAAPHARTPSEQAELMGVRVEALFATGDLDGVVDTGLRALDVLGVELPAARTPQDVARLVATLQAEIIAMGLPALRALAPMDDAASLQQMSLSARMTAAAYIARPQLLPLLTVHQVRLMIARGHAPAAMSAYSVLGLMVAEFLGDYAFGHALGYLSVELVRQHGWRHVLSHAGFSFNAFLRHWMEPITRGLPALMEVHHSGVEAGNLRHAGLGLYLHGCHAFLGGMPLGELEPLLVQHADALRRIRQPVAQDYLSVLAETVRALQGAAMAQPVLESGDFSLQRLEATYAARSDQTGAMFLHAFACLWHGWAGRDAQCEAEGAAAEALSSAGRGMVMVPFCLYYATRASLALARHGDASDAAANAVRRSKAAAVLQRFERWARHSTDIAPLWWLLQADVAADAQDAALARSHLETARDSLSGLDNGFVHGIVHSHRAQWLAAWAAPQADAARAQAHTAWQAWGARALAGDGRTIDDPHSEQGDHALSPQTLQRFARTITMGHDTGALDLATLMKAVQAVTGEIALAPLLERLLKVLLESAGAQRAVVVLRDDAGWRVQADSAHLAFSRSGAGTTGPSTGLLLEDAGAWLPLPMLRSALHGATAVQVQQVHLDTRWRALPYFGSLAGGSAACQPLVRQGRVEGVLYLENTALEYAFSPRRMEFLGLLSGNIVNALDNARLYQQLRALADSLEHRVAERTRELQESEARTLSILQNAPVPMTVTRRRDGVLVYANALAAALAGTTPDGLVGQLAQTRYRNPAEREQVLAAYRATGVLRDAEICLIRIDGTPIWTLISMVPIVYDGEPADLATLIDITERKSMEETLRRLATTDALTGVRNRGEFMRCLEAEIERARRYRRPLSLVLADLDNFKRINDRFGHSGGDEALRAFTASCMGLVRQQDVVGRLGGEEFGILMPETDGESALRLAERLRSKVEQLHIEMPGAGTLQMTSSFGVGTLGADGDDAQALLARSDAALYQAKREGRNRVCASNGG
jgi:diguanylate cyclase (GGDEF)-like protein/PAS domain S-box-containing protein